MSSSSRSSSFDLYQIVTNLIISMIESDVVPSVIENQATYQGALELAGVR